MNKNVLKFNTTNRMPYMRHRKKMFAAAMCVVAASVVLIVRLCVLMVCQSEYYSNKASDLHERQRSIKAMRGQILDRNGVVLASSRTVCTVSVIHSQIEDAEGVIQMLVRELAIDEQTARKRVEKVSSIEKVKSNVDKETGDRIRNYNYPGVKVDEDYKTVLKYLLKKYPEQTKKAVEAVNSFTVEDLKEILNNIEGISEERKSEIKEETDELKRKMIEEFLDGEVFGYNNWENEFFDEDFGLTSKAIKFLIDKFGDYGIDEESSLYDVGKISTGILELYLYAYKLAYEQLQNTTK